MHRARPLLEENLALGLHVMNISFLTVRCVLRGITTASAFILAFIGVKYTSRPLGLLSNDSTGRAKLHFSARAPQPGKMRSQKRHR